MNSLSYSSLEPGYVLRGKYQITEVMSAGRFGAVYQARDISLSVDSRLCATKEMLILAQDQQQRERKLQIFERQAETLAMLDHPAMPKIHDYFISGDRAYVIMEYIQGHDLQSSLNSTEDFLPAEQIRQWGIQICDALSYLHNHLPAPIYFHDMRPGHVVIDPYERVHLIDFGLSKIFQPEALIGTEGYMVPEACTYIPNPDPIRAFRANTYSLGATLHHLLTRRDPRLEPPFSFEARPIHLFNPDVSDAFAAVVMRAVAVSFVKRYDSAEEMKQALIAAG